MNIGPDTPESSNHRLDAPLTAEERALADRIAQTGPQREPSAALDARILAAAHAAVTTGPPVVDAQVPARPRVRRRWPVAVSAAATLVLAVGIAWQLRPVDDSQVEYSEAPRTAMPIGNVASGAPQPADASSPAQDAIASPALPAPAAQAVAPTVTGEEATATEKFQALRGQAVRGKTSPAPSSTASRMAPEEVPVTFDSPSPMDTPAPSPLPPAPSQSPSTSPPPPAPVPPAAAQRALSAPQAVPPPAPAATTVLQADRHESQARTAIHDAAQARETAKAATATGTRVVEPVRAESTANADADARLLDHTETSNARVDSFGDQPLDDQPPASADSPQVQQAWLKRVRALMAQGQRDAARDSLREYQRRYPKALLPDDLRALLVE